MDVLFDGDMDFGEFGRHERDHHAHGMTATRAVSAAGAHRERKYGGQFSREMSPEGGRMGLITTTSTISLIRVQRAGQGYGPAQDFIDVDVIVQLTAEPGKSFGFQLRIDNDGPSHRAMLDLLRDAYSSGEPMTFTYESVAGRSNFILLRVSRP